MNEEVDESEFYHQDFTTASEWEIFIARVEEVIHEWKAEEKKLNRDELNQEGNNDWYVKTDNIPFADVDFHITLYKHKTLFVDSTDSMFEDNDDDDTNNKNPIDTNYDFALEDDSNFDTEHNLSIWYGLKEYIIIKPTSFISMLSESRMKTLLSSATIVISNLNIETPIFIQIGEKWQSLYTGVYEGNGQRMLFEMIHLRRGPQHCQYLTGLLDMFKTKILSPAPLDVIDVSVRFTYQLSDFGKFTWKQDIFDVDVDNMDSSTLCMLPFGVTFDPVNMLLLRTKWSHLSDSLIVDSETYSDFEPMNAQTWTLKALMTEQPVSLLADCLTDFLHLLTNNSTIYDVLGDFVSTNIELSNPLDLLTESKVPTISSVLKRAARNSLSKSRRGPAPLTEDILVPMLYYLFPDAEEEPLNPYKDAEKDAKEKDPLGTSEVNNFNRDHKKQKKNYLILLLVF